MAHSRTSDRSEIWTHDNGIKSQLLHLQGLRNNAQLRYRIFRLWEYNSHDSEKNAQFSEILTNLFISYVFSYLETHGNFLSRKYGTFSQQIATASLQKALTNFVTQNGIPGVYAAWNLWFSFCYKITQIVRALWLAESCLHERK